MSGRVTLEDIAEASDTSVASVSLALRNKPGVSRARRERILAVAREMGYSRETPVASPDESAVRSAAVLFRSITSDRPATPLMDSFYSWVVTGIQEAAQDAGLHLMLGALRCDANNVPVELPPASFFDRASSGLFLLGSFPDASLDRLIEITGARGIPIVNVDGHTARTFVDSVGTMNREGAYEATSYLIQRGHSRIAFAGRLDRNVPSFNQRLQGYREAMAAHGYPTRELTIRGDREVSPPIEADDLGVTAIVVGNDYDATVLMRLLHGQGVRVPEDVSIIGFDDTEHATHVVPALTTMRVDMLTMGRLAVQAMAFRWSWPDAAPQMTLLRPQLVERDSVASISGQDEHPTG